MSKSTKPRKSYRPRTVNIPMMSGTRDDLALGLRMSIEAIIAAPSIETYNAVSLQLVTLGRVTGPQQFMEDAKRAMLDVFGRYERVGRIGVSDKEAAILREASGAMDAALAKIPVNKFHEAQRKTATWCRDNNVEY